MDKFDKIITNLRTLYPDAKTELNFTNEFELLIAVMLSAQCTDKMVNRVTPALFERFKCFSDLATVDILTLEGYLRQVNYYKSKSKNLYSLSQILSKKFNDQVPRQFEDLVNLPGIGRKTANVVLGELGAAATIAVDTHVKRVANRLGLVDSDSLLAIENTLLSLVRPEDRHFFHHALIFHGRYICKALRPQCAKCGLADKCRMYAIS